MTAALHPQKPRRPTDPITIPDRSPRRLRAVPEPRNRTHRTAGDTGSPHLTDPADEGRPFPVGTGSGRPPTHQQAAATMPRTRGPHRRPPTRVHG